MRRVIDIVCVSCPARERTPQLDAAPTDGALLQGRRDAEHASPGPGTAQGDVVHVLAASHDATPTPHAPPPVTAATTASSPALLRLALAQGEPDCVYNDSDRYVACCPPVRDNHIKYSGSLYHVAWRLESCLNLSLFIRQAQQYNVQYSRPEGPYLATEINILIKLTLTSHLQLLLQVTF